MNNINFEKLLEDCTECKESISMPDIKEILEQCIANLYHQSPDIETIKLVMGKLVVTNLLGSILFTFLTSLYTLCVLRDENKIEEYLQTIEEKSNKYIN